MEQFTFLPDPAYLPKAADPQAASRGREQLLDAAAQADDPALAGFVLSLLADPRGAALCDALFGNSPFLTQAALADPAGFRALITEGPDARCAAALADASAAASGSTDELMAALRLAKRQSALAIAAADIAGVWPLERVTGALSELAERSLSLVVAHLLRAAAARGEIAPKDPASPETGSGFAVLALGKLGARELNYSSDVDLFVLFDEEAMDYRGAQSPQQFAVRLARDMVRMMEERTQHGYVFRTDLRLRPDPGATPIAVNVLAAEIYYESMGQNWERAAMIKARPVAGDRVLGDAFVANLRPFIWRRNLDFAAIQDIHSIKRQINAHRGGQSIAVAGHNVKLGRGGIREIEFFAQTQQLIWGGREPALRTLPTCKTLDGLVAAGRVQPATAEELKESYAFLRRVEHRLQMIEDRQTHSLPDDDAALRHVAVFLGHDGTEAFAAELTLHLGRVEKHYGELFEEAPDLSGGSGGSLVFTGTEDDPETLKTLAGMGFKDGSAVSAVVRAWHHGRYRATRSSRARELLTELMPRLLAALGTTANPDGAFLNFDEFLKRLPAGVQLFSLFHANPELLELVAEIMGSAPRLAAYLSANPSLLDAVLTEGFEDAIPGAAALAAELDSRLGQARDFEDVLEISRRFANDNKFRVGLQTLRARIDADAQGAALADIADVLIARLYTEVKRDFARQHGDLPGGEMAVLGMGKLGGRGLAENSDLDLVFLYDAPDMEALSTGDKPLAAGTYYQRFGQRLLSALSVPTAEGKLYEVDMRLRPSGNSGPLVASLAAFRQYHAEASWTWEHMALTRARPIAGEAALRERLSAEIRAILTRPRDPDRLIADVDDMRQRILRARPAASIWDVKDRRGGLIDVEFIAQYLQLRHGHDRPEIFSVQTGTALAYAAQIGALSPAAADRLIDAERLWRTLLGMLRLTVVGGFIEIQAPAGLKAALATAAGAADFDALKRRMAETAAEVHAIFRDVIEDPAQRAAGATPRPPEIENLS
ncbi:MAG: bifunctional [glutamine synthetase] adenylyltransferase/[glutamine synthetase]-adenylyl-L-tyrosine phosphorylase [Alphaproteobacteria bacterium]